MSNVKEPILADVGDRRDCMRHPIFTAKRSSRAVFPRPKRRFRFSRFFFTFTILRGYSHDSRYRLHRTSDG